MAMFGFMDTVFPVLFIMVFVLVFGVIVASIFRGVGERRKNDNSPRLVVDAGVVAKRTDVSYYYHEDMMDSHSTTYYVTFEVKGGERLEFAVDGAEYGQLVEGDHGELTFQGTRYIEFVRNRPEES